MQLRGLVIDILDRPPHPAESVKNLVVWFISDFSLLNMFSVSVCCVIYLRDFRQVRQYLTHDTFVLVVNALISSQLDYCNSLFRSLSSIYVNYNISKIL